MYLSIPNTELNNPCFTATHIRAYFDEELPRSCMSLLRMSGDAWLAEVTPLKYNIKSFHGDKVIDLPGTSVLNIIDKCKAKSRIILYGEAGTGKSTTLSELCISWKKRIGLTQRFAQAYLLLVRNIVSPYASLEHIICNDLNIVPLHKEQYVRRFIKFNSASIIWFVDGYDERSSRGKKETTIDKLISGKAAPNSTVVVSSRPQDTDILSAIMTNKEIEIHVKGFDDSGVHTYLNKLPKDWAPTYRDLVVNSAIPGELLNIPIIVAMVCYIHQQVQSSPKRRERRPIKLVSTISVLDAVCGIFLGISEEKTTGCDFPHYTGYRDKQLTDKKIGMIKVITKLAFHSNPLLFAVSLKHNLLTSIGYTDKEFPIVRVTHEGDGNVYSNNLDLELSYQSRLFQECHDSSTKKEYMEQIKQYSLPDESLILTYRPKIQASAYISLVDALGLDGRLYLLKRAHQEAMTIDGGHATLSAPEGSTTRYITDTILISCLPVVDLIQTEKIVIQYCSLQVLAHLTRKCKVMCRVYLIKCYVHLNQMLKHSHIFDKNDCMQINKLMIIINCT